MTTTTTQLGYEPDVVFPPGDTLEEVFENLGSWYQV